MSNPDNCPNCDNIYGNEPRKIPCGHIVCHKCCLELFNKDDNTLICPVCDVTHSFKSKNIFKKSLQQVAHSGFGKKTSTREVGFASIMPVEKAAGAEKSSHKEVKKAAANLPTAPPGAPPESASAHTASPPAPPPPLVPPEPVVTNPVAPKLPPPVPLMPPRSSNADLTLRLSKQKQPTSTPPSLLNTIVSPPAPSPPPLVAPAAVQPLPLADAVIARCHSCGEKCQVIVCDHCDHFVCLKCAEKHRATTKVDTQELSSKWQECKTKYSTVLQKLSQYNHDRDRIERDLAAIRVAVDQRTRDAIEFVACQRDTLIERIHEHIKSEHAANSVKHDELNNEFQQIQRRYESALNGEDIGAYTQDDFLRDIRELQNRMSKRHDLIETHILRIPSIARYERVPIEKLLGELRFDPHMVNGSYSSSLITHQHLPKQNGYSDSSSIKCTINPAPRIPPGMPPPPPVNTITPPSNSVTATSDSSAVKPLMGESTSYNGMDAFDQFRRMAAHIHQQFNAPYSKVINIASPPPPPPPSSSAPPASSSSSSGSAPATDGPLTNGTHERNAKTLLTAAPTKTLPTSTFTKAWKVEHTAVPNFLCMTPYPTPKIFVVDKYGKVSVCSIPPKPAKPFDSYVLFPNDTDEWIESVVASSRFLIVYSRKKQDTMTGTLYFFTHECKPVLPNGIHQNIPVHHILCDQNANRLYCLDRMRCTIYYHPLPNSLGEIETCMKARRDFAQFNSNYTAVKMLQNDDILGFYERNDCTVHLYDKQTAEKLDEFKCEHFMDKFESWGIIAIRKDNNSLIFKVDERADHDAVTRQHIVYEVNRSSKQVISKVQLNSVFGMIIGPSNEVILGIRQTKESGIVQCYVRR